ncbi:MAG: TIR domain-containing protein [Gammaproteobacteria bacterium]
MEVASGDRRASLDETKELVSNGKRAFVYLSYVPEDGAVAQKISEIFEQRGMDCWYAARDQKATLPWPDCVNEAIETSRFFVVVLTARAAESKTLIPEIKTAVHAGRALVVLSVGDHELSPSLENELIAAHWMTVGEKTKHEDIVELWRLLVEIETGAVIEEDGIIAAPPGLVDPHNASGILLHLHALVGKINGRTTYKLDERQRLLIGRGPAVDIDVSDSRVSRRHAGIAVKRDPVQGLCLKVVDLMSTNGTWIRYFREGDSEFSKFLENGEATINSGAVIRVGSTDIRITSAHVPSNLIHLSSAAS